MIRRLATSLVMGLVLLTAGAARADWFAISILTGENEVPPVRTPGYAYAVFYVPEDMSFIYYYVEYHDLTGRATLANIHLGSPEENGPIVFNLAGVPGGVEGRFDGILTPRHFRPGGVRTYEQAVAALLRGQTYVNLTSSRYPRGEVRGQTYLWE